jgi:hypothetical protein
MEFIEVILKNNKRYSFNIEKLQSFKEMGIRWTRIYLQNDGFYDLDECYQEFVNKLNRLNK